MAIQSFEELLRLFSEGKKLALTEVRGTRNYDSFDEGDYIVITSDFTVQASWDADLSSIDVWFVEDDFPYETWEVFVEK